MPSSAQITRSPPPPLSFLCWVCVLLVGGFTYFLGLVGSPGNYDKAGGPFGPGWATTIAPLDVHGAAGRIPGLGASIAAKKIAEYRESGSIRAGGRVRAKIPSGVPGWSLTPGTRPGPEARPAAQPGPRASHSGG